MAVCHLPSFSNVFSETTGLIEAKFHIQIPWDGGMNVCSRGQVTLAKWPPCPYRVKPFKSLPLWN